MFVRQSVYPPSQAISTQKPVLHGHPWTFINVRLILPSPPVGFTILHGLCVLGYLVPSSL